MSTYTFAAVEARKLAGEMVPMDASQAGEGKLAFTLRRPIGVVGAISPFNFPLNLVAHKIAPALAAGCAVVLEARDADAPVRLAARRARERGGAAARLAERRRRAERRDRRRAGGGRARQADLVHRLVPVGWGIRERAPKKRVTLELGNATPVIVEADADVDGAAAKLAAHAFSFAGQSCISVQRIYVARDVYDRFLDGFLPKVEALKLGDPADEETDVGPVIDAEARERILEWIAEAREAGAAC